MGWRLAADVVVVVHVAFIVFVVAGGLLALRWRRIPLVHLPVALYGVLIELVGFTCPLTPLEKSLRRRAGSAGYEGGFVEQYVIPVVYPGEFTTTVKVVLAVLIVIANVLVYGVVWWRRKSVQPDDLAVRVDVDVVQGGVGPEPGHRAHVAADGVDEPGADGDPHLTHGQRPPGRRALP